LATGRKCATLHYCLGANHGQRGAIAIVTGMGSARNNINILSSDVVLACGNAEAGTLSEIALAFKARKSVVFLTEDAEAIRFLERTGRGLLHPAHTPEQAITLVHGLLDTL
jgi:uncharacterized protein (TIGR00725 family)